MVFCTSGNRGPERLSALLRKILVVIGKAETRNLIHSYISPSLYKSSVINSACGSSCTFHQTPGHVSGRSTHPVPSSVLDAVERCGLFVECITLCVLCVCARLWSPGEGVSYVCLLPCCTPGTQHTQVNGEQRSECTERAVADPRELQHKEAAYTLAGLAQGMEHQPTDCRGVPV